MAQELSPKKYIQTRARKLPIYKCKVNKDWADAGMADVVVMRRHVNGNITAGIYLVDLLCLGVKDTFFFFNEPEAELDERIPMGQFVDIDYPLAHNIIFSGHDFAMDFDIHPAKDFSITKYILEEDTDNVPLIEVHTGDEKGRPHLIVDEKGQYSDALAKLKKYAGEGNYYYTVRNFTNDIFDDGKPDNDEGEEPRRLDDYAPGTITPVDAKDIAMSDLIDADKVESRKPNEKLTLELEGMHRLLAMMKPHFFDEDVSELPEFKRFMRESTEQPTGYEEITLADRLRNDVDIYRSVYEELIPLIGQDEHLLIEKTNELLKTYQGSAFAPIIMLDVLTLGKDQEAANPVLDQLRIYGAKYPYAQLALALAALDGRVRVDGDFSAVYEAADIYGAFPQYQAFYKDEFYLFWLIKLLLAIRSGNVSLAIRYYGFICETEYSSFQLMLVQSELIGLLEPLIEV